MASFLDFFSTLSALSLHCDDDFYDRLSHRYTLGVLVISMIIVGTKQYVGDPITCWCPATFTGAHETYANNICWISNTYYLRPDEGIPDVLQTRKDRELSYYQWVPFILACMAAIYYTPHMMWRMFCKGIGLNINGIVKCVLQTENLNPDSRDDAMKVIVRHMDRYFHYQREHHTNCCGRLQQFLSDKLCLFCGKRFGNHIISAYLGIKLLYIANALGQMFLLNKFMSTDYALFGFEVVKKLVAGDDWKESRRFPRVTMCDFSIRWLGGIQNLHRYSIQCALPINLFNEKIFIFLWFWMAMVLVASIWGVLPWLRNLFMKTRMKYVIKHLKMRNQISSDQDKKLARAFAERYLRLDGIFVIRIIGRNTNDIIVSELIGHLWNYFKMHRQGYHPKRTTTVNV